MNRTPRRLYLFSSDQSRLYVQDILNVLAAPRGHPYTFRYDARYLDPAVRAEWDRLEDTEVVVVFSLQQRARFQEAAFIPIRTGWVLRTYREGSSHFVQFRLGGYVSLLEPPVEDGRERPERRVQAFTEQLGELTTVPYSASASLGKPLPTSAVDTAAEPSVLFSRIGSYLSHTAPFADARFVRVLGIKPTGSQDAEYLENYGADPVYELRAGKTYDLGLFHAQPVAPWLPGRFTVSADESAVRIIGEGNFAVASRYDRVTVRLSAHQGPGLEDQSTVVALEPAADVQGPTIQLEVRVKPSRGRAVGVASLQSLALIFVALAGVLTTLPLGARILLAVLGAVAAAGLGLVGATALRAPMLPSGPPPPPGAPASSPPSEGSPRLSQTPAG